MVKYRIIPVWFFVGLLLAIYGVLILASGLAEWSAPSTTILGEYHAPVWWGALMTVIGIAYIAAYRPRRAE
jgi:hypothetical protein